MSRMNFSFFSLVERMTTLVLLLKPAAFKRRSKCVQKTAAPQGKGGAFLF